MKKTTKKHAGRPFRAMHLFIAIVLAITLFAVFDDKGLLDVFRLRSDRDKILSYNRALEKENGELEKKIGLLKTDERYIGEIARKELGMIGRDEVMYRFENPE